MISQQRLEKAIIYLAETDETLAAAHVEMERAEFRAKATRDAIFLHSEGTVAERAAKAGVSTEYDEAMSLYFAALGGHDKIKNKRNTEELVIDVWRSIEASRRKA
jgi:hypothetical protein